MLYDISDISFLIIDDNAYMRSIIKTMLSGFGVRELYEASDAPEGFELFSSRPVDIIIIDLKMETLDGNEFVQLVRTAKDSPNPFVPIIMITAYTERKTVELARDCGVTELLSKPICARDLYMRVVEIMERPREFIHTSSFMGPDRRRNTESNYKGPERRKNVVEV